jgi:hypothetical protein
MNSPPTNIVWTGNGTGVVEIGSKAQPLTVSFTCSSVNFGTATCNYEATDTARLKVSEYNQATMEAPLVKLATSGSFLICGTSSTYTLKITDVVSENTFISKATETVLCGETSLGVCPNGAIKPAGTTAYVGGNAGFKLTPTASSGAPVECPQTMWFTTASEGGSPLAATMGSAIYTAACKAFTNGQPCTAASWNNPPSTISSSAANKGTIAVGTAAQPLTLTVTCQSYLNPTEQSTCKWAAKGPVNISVDESNAVVTASPMTLVEGTKSIFFCGSSGEATLSLSQAFVGYNGAPLYINSI